MLFQILQTLVIESKGNNLYDSERENIIIADLSKTIA